MSETEDFLAAKDLIPAAVLIPLLLGEASSDPAASATGFRLKTSEGSIDLPASTQIVLTVRTQTVAHHKGQISFPGGTFDPTDESLVATALREAEEEIGLNPAKVRIVAELPDVPTVATRFRVRPYVGLIETSPTFALNPGEIGELLIVPLRHLCDSANSIVETYERNGVRYPMRTYLFEGHRIWGATGRMLQIFLEKFVSSV